MTKPRRAPPVHEWPELLPSLGLLLRGQPFARCRVCGPSVHPAKAGTFLRYGSTPLCLAHAVGLSARAA